MDRAISAMKALVCMNNAAEVRPCAVKSAAMCGTNAVKFEKSAPKCVDSSSIYTCDESSLNFCSGVLYWIRQARCRPRRARRHVRDWRSRVRCVTKF